MFIMSSTENGTAADVSEDIISGQFVSVAVTGADSRLASLVGASGDIAVTAFWGLAYYDPYKADYERIGGTRESVRVAHLNSANPEIVAKVAEGTRVTVLQGRIRGSTNQLEDGTYGPNQYLTVDYLTARLRAATGSEIRHARVEGNQRPVVVNDQDQHVMVLLNIPDGFH